MVTTERRSERRRRLSVRKYFVITSQHSIPLNIWAKNEKLYCIQDTAAYLRHDSSLFSKETLISIIFSANVKPDSGRCRGTVEGEGVSLRYNAG